MQSMHRWFTWMKNMPSEPSTVFGVYHGDNCPICAASSQPILEYIHKNMPNSIPASPGGRPEYMCDNYPASPACNPYDSCPVCGTCLGCDMCAADAAYEQEQVYLADSDLDRDLERARVLLNSLQGQKDKSYYNREMSLAITRLEEALSWLEKVVIMQHKEER